jgi:hypothetical protein
MLLTAILSKAINLKLSIAGDEEEETPVDRER